MKAVMCKKYGGPEVTEIVEVEKPVCKNNDVLIKIKSFTVTLPDCAFRKGEPFIARFFSGLSKPKFIPGDILAGIIEEIGKNVTLFKKGDEVYGCTGTSFGAHAEYISLNENSVLVKKPDNLSFEEASGLCYEGLTGLPFLRDNAHIKQGDKILIIGASSSVGLSAVQLAKYYGAYVTGVSSAKNLNIVKSLGAQKVIDYTKEDYTKTDEEYDIVFDAVGKSSFNKCRNILKSDGKYLTTVPTFEIIIKMIFSSKSKGKKAIFAATGLRKDNDKKSDLNFLNNIYQDGKIKSIIDRIYKLEEISEAHKYVDTEHKTGNVVIKLN